MNPTGMSSSGANPERRSPRSSGARRRLALLAGALLGGGCAHVPPEAVQLSYQVGQDLPQLHQAYDNLIHQHFEDLRMRRSAYVDEVWAPDFLRRWIAAGRLVEVAQGKAVWSFDKADFVTPTRDQPVEMLATVREWSEQAIWQIEQKRRGLLDPLDKDEEQLRRVVKDAFTRVIQANAFITAHLASVRRVEQGQDQALKELGLKDLRDTIDNGLVAASDAAAKGLEEVRKADQLLDRATELKDKHMPRAGRSNVNAASLTGGGAR